MEPTIVATWNGRIARRFGDTILAPGVPREVPLSFLSLYGQTSELTYDFTGATDFLVARTEAGRTRIDWRSPLSGLEGYGRHAIWLIRALQRAGVEVAVHDVVWVRNTWLPDDIASQRHTHTFDLPARIGVSFTLGYDPNLYNHSSLYKIAVTQFESDHLPEVHARNVNMCDHVVVTSRFQIDVFRDSGVKIPISVMRPGIEVEGFPYVERRKDGLFKVLLMGGLTPRKNPVAAVRIFQQAADGNPDWRLTIKTRAAWGIDQIRAAAARDPRISIIVGDSSPDEVVGLYHAHDCFLWPSKGEGVGLPPLEAMATGMELVCADNSGMRDYLDDEWAYPIKTSHKESAEGEGLFSADYVAAYGHVGNWWVPDERHAMKQLDRCFKNWYDGKGKGDRAAEVVRQRFSIDHSAADLVGVIERYV